MPKTRVSHSRGPPIFIARLYGAALASSLLAFLVFTSIAEANPTGGAVTNGSASIVTSGNTLDIDQSTQRAVINWQSFNIAPNETTQFNQPSSSSVTLNRVNASTPSQILGTLKANGNVVLVNPNGVFFGNGSQVDVNGLIATTANIGNANFMAGKMNFSVPGNPNAAIVNQGTITANQAGLVGLVAPNVINSGTINAKLGHVDLGSGDTFTLDTYGDGLINVGVSNAIKQQLIQNKGTINAAGGSITITAAAGRNVVNSLISVPGKLNAPTAQMQGGSITISNANSSGAVRVNGALDATGTSAGQTGGAIAVTAHHVNIMSGAVVDASGNSGGGTVLIGGGLHGQGTLAHASKTLIGGGAAVKANALQNGNGGEIVVWSDQQTTVDGSIQAEGGSAGGNGGFIETSSHGVLKIATPVDASAPKGTAGTWLLDPASVTITNAADANMAGCPACTPDGTVATSNISTTTIDAALNAGTNVSITTGGDSAANTGDITVSNAISTTGTGSLTLSSYRDIILNAGITLAGGALTLRADNAANGSGYIDIEAPISTGGGNIAMGGGAGVISAGTGFAVGNAGQVAGIFIDGVNVSAGGGNIIINGQGENAATNGNIGVEVTGAAATLQTSGVGTISVTGNGAGNTNSGNDYGVEVDTGAVISAVNGTVTVNGTGGGGTGGAENGINISSGTVETTGTGNIAFIGQGGLANVNGNIGVEIDTGVVQAVNAGSIQLTGTGGGAGGGSYEIGVDLSATGSDVKVTNGNLTINGTGGSNPGNFNYGVQVETGAVVETSGTGNVNINGQGGGQGVSSQVFGVLLYNGGIVRSTAAGGGQINITRHGGDVGGSTDFNVGVSIENGSSTVSSVDGNINITGYGSNSTGINNWGVATLGTTEVLSTGAATINISGTGGGTGSSSSNYGVYLGSVLTQGSGNIVVNALGGNGGGGTNSGAVISNANGLQTTGSGNVTVLANTLTLNAANDINSIANLTIEPETPNTTVGIGAGTGTLALPDNYFTSGYLAWGAGHTLTIGGANAGTMDINTAAAFANPAVFQTATGNIILDNTLTSSVAVGTSLTLISGQNFINNADAAAINPGGGRWLSYSGNPALDTDDGLAANFDRFSCTYGGSCPAFPAAGNGFLYRTTPDLTAMPNAVNITYGGAAPSLTGYAYTLSGYLGSDASADTVTGSLNGTTSYVTGANAGSYNINYASGSLASTLGYGFIYASNAAGLVVNPYLLAVMANAQSKIYGAADPAFTYTNGALQNGDTSSVFTGSLSRFAGQNVGTYAITQGTLSAGPNYTITYTGNNLAITPYALTVTATAQSKAYGAADPVLTFTNSALQNGDTNAIFAGAQTRVAGENVGTYVISQGTLSAGANYTIAYTGNNLSITPYALAVTANAQSKAYGAADPALTYTNGALQNGDTSAVFTGSLSRVGGQNVGTYAINQGTLSAGGNYTITYAGNNLAITPYALAVTANAQSKVYGAADPVLTYTNGALQNSDTSAVFTGALTRVAGQNVGAYAINDGTLSAGANYTITYTGSNLTVIPAPLTITANSFGKTYAATYAFAGTEFAATGLVNGDTATGATLSSAGAAAAANVGGYAITLSGAVGTGLGNYTISYVNGQLTVNPAALTITANNLSKTYGTTYGFAGTEFSASGLVNGDTVSSAALASPGAAAGATVAGSPYTITASNAVGSGLSNYIISYVNGQLAVNPAALAITANNLSKTYGTTYGFAGTEFSASGLVNGDTVSSATLASPGAAATATVAGGPYAITASGATGTGLSNYTISYVSGELTVNPAALTVTANGFSKVYGTTYAFTGAEFTALGLKNSDTVTSATLASGGTAAGATAGGSPYVITASNAVGSGLSNYTISYVNGAMTVNPAALTITAKSFDKLPGTAYTFTGTEFRETGLVNGDTLSSATLASVGAPVASPTGVYPITISNAVGMGLANYVLTYNDGLLTVVTTIPSPTVSIPGTVASTADGASDSDGHGFKIPISSLTAAVSINLCLADAAQDTLSGSSMKELLDLVEISPDLAASLPFYKIPTHVAGAFHITCGDTPDPTSFPEGAKSP